MIKKVRHLVESLRANVVIQIDHSAILDIMQQSILNYSYNFDNLPIPPTCKDYINPERNT